ncbi:uncharacterized protein LOC128257563 [Drosophila gunungcola]|uniref:Uncharacterized protein n=1 Tax=Drosophila gunungcola TaxID=103775 RepID=A0A9Q0BR04_9MUSC|nr:uncharacterized protein LOC128257563 [Drosophila gunungcola]KAI8041537.1 hypothetical protein M5D96_005802 [Drosophila gunungcola]
MEINESFDDVEDQLDNFVIRRNQQKGKATDSAESGPKIHENIPLTLWHILRANEDPERENVFIIRDKANNPIHFRTCIVYGFVVGFGTHNECFSKYLIDDGTGSLEASIAKKPGNRLVISSLHNEVTSLGSSEAFRPTAERLVRLLKTAMEYIDPSPITRGHNLFLRGRPNYFRGVVGMDAFQFFIDSGRSRNMEMGFADYLTDWHNNYSTT